MCATEIRADKPSAAEAHAVKVRAGETRAAEVRRREVRAAEVRAYELCAAEPRAAEFRVDEARAGLVSQYPHAGISWRLNAGTPGPQVAEWAGHSVEVLYRVYAHCIHGDDERWYKRMEEFLG